MKTLPIKLPSIFNQTNPNSPLDKSPLEPDSVTHINYQQDYISQSFTPSKSFNISSVEVIVITVTVMALFVVGYFSNKRVFKKSNCALAKLEEETMETDSTTPEPIISEEKSKFPVNIYILEDKRQKVINAPANAIFIYA